MMHTIFTTLNLCVHFHIHGNTEAACVNWPVTMNDKRPDVSIISILWQIECGLRKISLITNVQNMKITSIY